MPRLSIDIDLAYLPIGDHEASGGNNAPLILENGFMTPKVDQAWRMRPV